MKQIRALCISVLLSQVSLGELVIPPDILRGFVDSTTGESGGFSIRGVDEERFVNFIKLNWRSIAANIETLPKRPNSTLFKNQLSYSSLIVFGAACETLPPEEYLDFFDQLINLREQDRIPFHSIDRLMLGIQQKDCFFAVNWEHPRVQAIFKKVKQLTPADEKSFYDYVNAASRGELADTYLENRSEGNPLPQTLPGIKLRRPWESMIKKFEVFTGKKSPRNPESDPRSPRRHNAPLAQASITTLNKTQSIDFWKWSSSTIALFSIAFLIWKFRCRSKSRLTPRL